MSDPISNKDGKRTPSQLCTVSSAAGIVVECWLSAKQFPDNEGPAMVRSAKPDPSTTFSVTELSPACHTFLSMLAWRKIPLIG